jgi:hypothetical protein
MRIELSYLLPYDWPQVRDFLASRAVAGVEQVDEDAYSRIASGATISVNPAEDALALHGRGPARGVTTTVRRVFDLSHDPANFLMLRSVLCMRVA